MITKIRKRDGRYVKFNEDKITEAIQKAILAVDAEVTLNKVYEMTKEVVKIVEAETPEGRIPTVENVQDIVEKVLMNSKLTEVAKAYILYREERSKVREQKSKLMKTFQAIELDKKTVSNFLSRRDVFHYENPTKSILAYGREGAKEYNKMFMVDNEYIKLHEEGDIFIKEIEYYTASLNTLQLDSVKCVENLTLKGNIIAKNLKTIDDYLMCLTYIIAKAEDDLYGGVSISDFDYLLAKAVEKNHLEIYLSNVKKHLLVNKTNYHFEDVKSIENIDEILTSLGIEKEIVRNLKKLAENELEENLFNALSKFLLNIKMMPTKNQCGIINASIAYGTDESVYGRLVTKNILLATLKGLEGHLYTTPVQIFKVKEGINYNKEDKNYDLFQLAIKTQSLKMYPNFMFLDAESNKIKGVNNVRELTYGATRNRTINNKPSLGKGSISETVINLPRVALSSNNIDEFYENLKNILNKIAKEDIYHSPTDMGVNMVAEGIVNNEIVEEAAKKEIVRRYYTEQANFKQGLCDYDSVQRIKLLLTEINIDENYLKVVKPAIEKSQQCQKHAMAIQLQNGKIITGRENELLSPASSLIINAMKVLTKIPDEIDLLSPTILEPILKMRKGLTQLSLQEVLIALSICSVTNPMIAKALQNADKLKNCDVHSTYIVQNGDLKALKSLGVNLTSQPTFYSNELF